MALSDVIIIGGLAAWLIHDGLKKDSANQKQEENEETDYNRIVSSSELTVGEWLRRRRIVNAKRLEMPCLFNDGLSADKFIEFAERAGRKIKRVKSVTVRGAVIYCNVESQTGYSNWDFSVDFNNWGHVEGTYWTKTDNDDSSVPHHYGDMVSGWIHDFYREHSIVVNDFSEYIDKNIDLGIPAALNYSYKEKFLDKIFIGHKSGLTLKYGSTDLIGEHLYSVLSVLRDAGFKNIKTFSVKDMNDDTPGYYYMVEQIVIEGSGYFESGAYFPENTEVLITYHEKQVICMPFSEGELKHDNYVSVRERLQKLGFVEIYERKMEDLVTGWIVKEGSVERVLLDGDEDKPILKNASYDYDQKIVILYHAKKSKK